MAEETKNYLLEEDNETSGFDYKAFLIKLLMYWPWILGSVAVKNPGLFKKWLEQYGNEKIILGADVKENKISVNGWKEESQQQLIPFLKDYTKEGVFKVLCTDISRDGMLQGPSVELYQQILKEFPNMHLIASGGVSCIQDIIDLEIAKVPAVVFGKALYEGKITLKDLNRFM
jgi:phosphoribosylformimino-5-aminoimidazole carboxamide ribotide isomerase